MLGIFVEGKKGTINVTIEKFFSSLECKYLQLMVIFMREKFFKIFTGLVTENGVKGVREVEWKGRRNYFVIRSRGINN